MRSLGAGIVTVLVLTFPLAVRASSFGDLDLLTLTGSVPPNLMLFLDNSSSMDNDVDGDPLNRNRMEVGHAVLRDFVDIVNPDDGAGGVIERARLGFATFNTKKDGYDGKRGAGATIDVPVGPATNKAAMIAAIDAILDQHQGDGITSSGTPIGEALVDIGRYFAVGHVLGAYPTDLAADRVFNDPQEESEGDTQTYEPICSAPCPSPIDLECRKSFAILVTDGGPNRDKHDHYGVPLPGKAYDSGDAYTTFMDFFGNADGDANESTRDFTDPGFDPAVCSLLRTQPGFDPSCVDDPMGGRDDGNYPENQERGEWIDDVAYRLYRTDMAPGIPGEQPLVTYAIGFGYDHSLNQETADNGGGLYITAQTADALEGALYLALLDALARSGSFTAASVPASRTGSGDLLLRAWFEPKISDAFWAGHLQAFELAADGEILDQNGDRATDATTGMFDPNAVPFWDAATELKTNTSRNIYTTKPSGRVDFTKTVITSGDPDLNAGEIPSYPNYNAPAVNIITVNDLRDAIVDYLHGQDAFDEDADGDTTEMRDIVLGDIFHSSPVTVGHPTEIHEDEQGFGPKSTAGTFLDVYGNRDRVVYAGGNDGMLHAFLAGVAGDDPGTAPVEDDYYDPGTGAELFGYIPGILLPKVKMIPKNSPRSEYYVDGSPAVADAWLGANHNYNDPKTADEWATVLVTGMRDGGEGYLALDITDPNATAGAHGPYPKLLWEFTHAKLGDGWSKPIITRVKVRGSAGLGDKCGYNSGDGDCREQWVAIFGGGYRADGNPNNPSYISDPSSGSWSDKSKGIFMVSLDTGELIGSATFDSSDASANGLGNMKYALPSTPAVLDLDFDGFADVVYIGDLGGQMWKWDISEVGEDLDADDDYDNWDAGVFFRAYPELDWAGGVPRYRNIFFPPTAAYVKGQLTLVFGTGERDDPLHPGAAGQNDNNRFYVVKDVNPTGGLAFGVPLYEEKLTDITGLDSDTNPMDAGFFFIAEESEKFVTTHTIYAGFVITASFTPPAGGALDCTGGAGGRTYLYVFDLFTGLGFFVDGVTGNPERTIEVGSGFPSDPQISVGPNGADIYLQTSDGNLVETDAPGGGAAPLRVIYWREVF
jgi:type IV pilus assembly protein PilY1